MTGTFAAIVVDICPAEHAVRFLTAGLVTKSGDATAAASQAVDLVGAALRLQAYTLAFIDAFHLIAWMSVITLIHIATLRRLPLNFRDLAALDAGARQARTGDAS